MWSFFYTLIMYCVQPLILAYNFIRSIKSPNYRKRLLERYAFYPTFSKPQAKGIVIHAASVGEVIAATPLVKQIQQQYPHLSITFTTVTPTGSDRVKAAFGPSVFHVYLPYDLPDAIGRFLNFVQPKLCIVIETEIWPNLIKQLHSRNIPFVIANARLSGRSAKRYGWVKNQLQHMFSQISLIAPQDKVSQQRYIDLGYNPEKLKLTGNIKYDLVVTEELAQKITALRQSWIENRPVWIAASTHEGEEEIILQAHKQLLNTYPELLLILVPRHPERFNPVADLIEKQGLSYIRRSAHINPSLATQVVLGDTMGELMLMYGIADIALVGGSLVKHGGHNPLEPLAFKLPVISGQYTFNFPEVYQNLVEVEGVILVHENSQELESAVRKLLDSPELCKSYGASGYEVLVQNRGALQRLFELLQPYLEKA